MFKSVKHAFKLKKHFLLMGRDTIHSIVFGFAPAKI